MNSMDPATAAQLDRLGVPAVVAAGLARLGVGIHLVERLSTVSVRWEFVEALLRSKGLQQGEDVAALVSFLTSGATEGEVEQWARLGRLDAAYRLQLKAVSPSTVQSFPTGGDDALTPFLRMLQATLDTGIHSDDLVWWHTAGVISLQPPHLDRERWATWRAVAAHHMGFRDAALAAAAGMSPEEAVAHWHRGEFSADAMRMMAALRAGTV